jgi:Rieske Fe-S protein
MSEKNENVPRRQVIEMGVAGAALLVLPEGCGSTTTAAARHDASVDAPIKDASKEAADVSMEAASPPCKTSFVDAGSGCAQSDQTAAVNILKAGIDQPGTSYEFSDCRYMDPACTQDRIILINPTTKKGYVALSGSCTHDCCDNTMGGGGPIYFPVCKLSVDTNILSGFLCSPPDASAPEDASVDGGPDAGDASTDATSDVSEGGLHGGETLVDVLYCTCHGSIFNALTGDVIHFPASASLQQLSTCEADGWVFITIPKSP